VPFHADLGGEDVPHNARFVHHVRHPAGEQTEGVWHPIELPDLTPLVAEQGEGEIVFLREGLVRFDRVGANTDDLGIEISELLEIVLEGTDLSRAAQGIVLGVEVEDHGLTEEVA
jgi:hypothetical protein